MIGRSISPPTVTDVEKLLRRQAAMAYRTAREAMLSHEAAIDAPLLPGLSSQGAQRWAGDQMAA